jgi:hypothetical protein
VRASVFAKNCDRKDTPDGRFYDEFYQCWKDKVAEAKTKCKNGENLPYCEGLKTDCDASGGLNCTNPNHKDHMHLSLPFCPPLDRIAET